MKINQIINEFVAPQATAQDPGLEREKDVDVIFYGQMPRDFTAIDVIEALEAVLPREYPPGTSHNTIGIPTSKAELIALEIGKHQGAVVTTKPLSVAQKLVKTFQTYGIKCTIHNSGLEEDLTRRGFLQGLGAAALGAAGVGTAQARATPEWFQMYSNAKSKFESGSDIAQVAKALGVSGPNNGMVGPMGGSWGAINKAAQDLGIGNRQSATDVKPSAPAQSQMPKVDQVDRQKMTIVLDGQEYPLVILSATDFRPRSGQPVQITCAQMGERCIGRYDALLTQGRVFVLPGTKPPIVPQGVDEGTGRLPQPEDFESDNDYYDAMDAYGKTQDTDSDYENWAFDDTNESREKVGNMDADAFDAALARMKKLAGAGPLKTVYDPTKRVYKNVPTAVQPAQQPRKEKK